MATGLNSACQRATTSRSPGLSASSYDDFEDAVLMAAADSAGADYVVTRDAALFRPGPLPAVTPAELLALLGA